jgi:lactoylglutathione lyase
MSTATEDAGAVTVIPGRPTWQQTMLRIKDPVKSVQFYTEQLGFTLIDTLDFPQFKFSLYFLTTLPKGTTYDLTPGTSEAHDYLWSMEGTALELTHNHGTESDDSFKGYHAGNQEKDGFGHVAVK